MMETYLFLINENEIEIIIPFELKFDDFQISHWFLMSSKYFHFGLIGKQNFTPLFVGPT